MDFSHVKANLEEVNLRISHAARKAGRTVSDIRLAAVSKTFPPDAVLAAHAAGQRLFAENKVQELAEKSAVSPNDIEWHLIGHLQSNKAAKAVSICALVHSADSESLLARISRIASETGKVQRVLLEMNVSGEESKFGIGSEDGLFRILDASIQLKGVQVEGLMTMAPFAACESELRRIFSSLRILRDKAWEKTGVQLKELSMGMSGDFEIAIEEGASIVRIGSLIFGKRAAKPQTMP